MALIIKSAKRQQNAGLQPEILSQYIRVRRDDNAGAGVNLPATTTGRIFRVKGGRVLVQALIATVTTATQAQACNFKVSAQKLTNAGATVGTAVDIAANVAIDAGLEVGAHIFVEGDGTAAVLSTAGAVLMGANSGAWVAEQGQIYVTTSATNTGKVLYDLWYQPLDPGAFVDPEVLSSGILLAKI